MKKLFELLASYGFAVVLLTWLLVLTYVGTIAQVDNSLYEVQKKYFESWFLVHQFGPVPVPFPGVHLLLVLLGVNLLCGGIVRLRKSWKTAGIFVAHLGIIAMLFGSLAEFQLSQKGHTSLLEGSRSNEFQSYFEWEISIAEGGVPGAVTEHVIPGKRFIDLSEGARATFTSADLPFDLTVERVTGNSRVVPGSGSTHAGNPVVEGFALMPLPKEKKAEADLAGCYVRITPKQGGEETEGLLWGGQRYPLSVHVDGKRWTIDFGRRRWQLPFEVILDDFRKVDYPGMSMAKAFESDIRKVEGGVEEPVLISMNAPLRDKGYTLYQASFSGPFGGDKYQSTFAVVRNPADQVPLYSCIIITIGLLAHFIYKLVVYIGKVNRDAGRSAA